MRNSQVQRFNSVSLILKYTLISAKQLSPLRDGREAIYVTIFLSELISDQPVRLFFFSFGGVVSVFEGRHKFNNGIRNDKRHVKIFPEGGDPEILPKKIYFHGSIQSYVLFPEKVVLYYWCKTRYMLGEIFPVATLTPEDSGCLFLSRVVLLHRI